MFWVSPIIVRMILRTQNLKPSIFAVASKTYPSPYGAYGYIAKKCRHTQMVDYRSNAWSPWEVFLAVANVYRNDNKDIWLLGHWKWGIVCYHFKKQDYDLKLSLDLKMVYFSSERKLNTMVKAQPLSALLFIGKCDLRKNSRTPMASCLTS